MIWSLTGRDPIKFYEIASCLRSSLLELVPCHLRSMGFCACAVQRGHLRYSSLWQRELILRLEEMKLAYLIFRFRFFPRNNTASTVFAGKRCKAQVQGYSRRERGRTSTCSMWHIWDWNSTTWLIWNLKVFHTAQTAEILFEVLNMNICWGTCKSWSWFWNSALFSVLHKI